MRFSPRLLGILFIIALITSTSDVHAKLYEPGDAEGELCENEVCFQATKPQDPPDEPFEPASVFYRSSPVVPENDVAKPAAEPSPALPAVRPPLDVVYFNQNNVKPIKLGANRARIPIGEMACGCTSVAMIFAYAGIIKSDEAAINKTVHECFGKTSEFGVGIKNPEQLVRYIKKEGLSGSGFLPLKAEDKDGRAFILSVLKIALERGMPQLLSVRAPSTSGHYLVVTGIIGDDPETADLIVNDSYGRWEECRRGKASDGKKCYNDPTGDGKAVRYNFAEIVGKGGRLFIIR